MEDAQSAHFNSRELSPFIAIYPLNGLVHEEGEGIEHVIIRDFGGFDVVAMKVIETRKGCESTVRARIIAIDL